MREGVRFVAGVLVLLLLVLFIIAAADYVTKPYNSKTDKIEKTLYSDDEDMNQTDVAFIGGSHGVNGFNPSVIWRDARIRAYNFCFAGEPLYLTHYYTRELLKKRKFDLVVFDWYYIGLNNRYFSRDSYVFDLLRNMKWSRDKVDFIQTCVSPKDRGHYYFPLITYHTRWSELTRADILRTPDLNNDYWLGSDYYFERYGDEPVSFEPWADSGEVVSMPEYSEKYLRQFIELVQESGSELLMVDLPHRYNDANAPDVWVENEYPVYNHAKQIAEEYGVSVLQFDDVRMAEIGFVPERDMFNKGHMNIYGSEKVSHYLGEYIQDHYDVTQIPRQTHDLWDDYLEKYEKVYEENYRE